jgi:hypothetical protein
MVGLSPEIWHATPDQSMGVPPPSLFGGTRVAGGTVAAAAGVVRLAYSASGWAAFFLVIGVLNLAGGYWYMAIARSAAPRV